MPTTPRQRMLLRESLEFAFKHDAIRGGRSELVKDFAEATEWFGGNTVSAAINQTNLGSIFGAFMLGVQARKEYDTFLEDSRFDDGFEPLPSLPRADSVSSPLHSLYIIDTIIDRIDTSLAQSNQPSQAVDFGEMDGVLTYSNGVPIVD